MATVTRLNRISSDSVFFGRQLQALRLSNKEFYQRQIELSSFDRLIAIDSQFKDVHLSDSSCCQFRFSSCTINKCRAERTFFTHSAFNKCCFTGINFHLSDLGESEFDETVFCDTRITETAFTGSFWKNCTISDADWFFVRMPSAIFDNVTFENCKLKKTIFRTSEFYNCKFINCDVTNTVFHRSHFCDTEFIETDLNQADNLTGITGVQL